MTMPELWIQQVAEEFWQSASCYEPFPRNLESALLWALPVALVKIPRLQVSGAREWLIQRHAPMEVNERDRGLHACVFAFAGKGIIFLDGRDAPDEMRFSLAHEIAHFLIDYLRPRKVAVERFGESIVGVLDGFRCPTKEERGAAILSSTQIGAYRHMMNRSTTGSVACSRITRAETYANKLALELLAPEALVRRLVQERFTAETRSQSNIVVLLKETFGLPKNVASVYSLNFATKEKAPQSVRQWLGIG
jgi:hypothetical protein